MSVAGEKVRQHGTYAGGGPAVEWAQNPGGEKNGTVSQVDIALHGGGNLDDQGHDGTQGGKEGG
ncbi:Uncharacterised protein [uncultured Clostridium sp.]|nr:Uncharacterised protein [uncultured Clostridium sp.]